LKAAKCNSRSEVQEKPTKIGTQTKAEKAKRRRVQKSTKKEERTVKIVKMPPTGQVEKWLGMEMEMELRARMALTSKTETGKKEANK